jgi:hypothetical protein
VNLTELERYLDRLDDAGLIDDVDKDEGGWAEFSKTMLEDVNAGQMDSFVFILMKMLADYKNMCDKLGRLLPNPELNTGMDIDDNAEAAYAVGVDTSEASTDLDGLDLEIAGLPSALQADIKKRLITDAKRVKKALGAEAYFTHMTRRYSKLLMTGRYFVYPGVGRFRMLRGHVARIDTVNKTKMLVHMVTGPSSDPTDKHHKLDFPFSLLPDAYFEV